MDVHVLSRDKCGASTGGTAMRWKLEQTGGIDTKRAVNGAPGSPRTVCHAVITGNTARRARPEGEEEGVPQKEKKGNITTPKTAGVPPQGVSSKPDYQNKQPAYTTPVSLYQLHHFIVFFFNLTRCGSLQKSVQNTILYNVRKTFTPGHTWIFC